MTHTWTSFHSSDPALNRGFDWALRQARDYVVSNAPAGPCYEAALPGRSAYCMRDTAHQALGAHIIGEDPCNRNMLGRFAGAANEAKNFCSFWEITFDGSPCAEDYKNDADFWYNLPANFDILDAAYRMFNWTGDAFYLFDKKMDYFHRTTTGDYIRAWDRDRDGIVDRKKEDGRRGIASYDESPRNQGYVTAADTLAAQYAALRDRAEMLALAGEHAKAGEMYKAAGDIQKIYEEEWWDEPNRRFAPVKFSGGDYGGEYTGMSAFMPLYYNIITDKRKLQCQLEYVIREEGRHNQEERSYLPEILWRYGRGGQALEIWRTMVSPDYRRREYPEISFAALGALVSGLMGIEPRAASSAVLTRSAMGDGGFGELNYLPLWQGYIHLYSEGQRVSVIENFTGRDFVWRCCFGEEMKTLPVRAGQKARCERN